MAPPAGSDQYHDVVARGFFIASEHDRRCNPVHLLAALSELDGAIGEALTPAGGGPLLPRPPDAPHVTGGGGSYLSMQTQQAARELAVSRHEILSPAHLLVAVIDQADREAIGLLAGAGIDPGQARQAALTVLGAPPDLPAIGMPPLTPAGYLDRPILSQAQLDPAAWQLLTWRQAHLPLNALKSPQDWRCLRNLETETADRLYRRLRLHCDQELSLRAHHLQRVQQIAHDARPDVVPPIPPTRRHDRAPVARWLTQNDRPRHWQPGFLRFTIGWGTWFGNRWSGLRRRRDWIQTRLFAARTRASYKGAHDPPATRPT